MPVYEYEALNQNGKNIAGLINADNTRSANLKLRRSKIFPISMTEIKVQSENRKTFFPFSNIKISEIAMITRQLATLIAAGFPLTTALNTVAYQIKKQSFKRVLSKIKDSIEEGNSFAVSLTSYQEIFSDTYINMVKAGEASGTLDLVLERLADIFEKQHKLNKKIKAAMAYPLLMTFVSICILFFLLTVIVPDITSIFDEMNQSLPVVTQILINISQFLRQWWLLIFSVIIFLFFFYNSIKKKTYIKTIIDKFILKLPVIGNLAIKIYIARFTRTLGALLENGVPLLESLEIVRNITGNTIIKTAIINAEHEVESGRELSEALSQNNVFPYLSVQMIKVGEKSGSLEPMLNKTAQVYENEIETIIIGMTSMLEPVIILIMGVVVGFIVISICLPIFEMNQLIK